VTVRKAHAYAHGGRYRLVVKARDRAGNATLFKRTVGVG
jgi:hypothetical protein